MERKKERKTEKETGEEPVNLNSELVFFLCIMQQPGRLLCWHYNNSDGSLSSLAKFTHFSQACATAAVDVSCVSL